MKDCIFCKITQGEIKSYIVKESPNFLAVLDIHPHSPGHTLVIPKEHFVNLKELKLELAEEFIKMIQEIMILLEKVFMTNDFTLGINEGPLAGQTVSHLHFHIMPRFKNDRGGSIHSVVYNPPQESLEVIYQRIKNES